MAPSIAFPTWTRLTRELALLSDPSDAQRAAVAGGEVRAERGAETAAGAIERVLR